MHGAGSYYITANCYYGYHIVLVMDIILPNAKYFPLLSHIKTRLKAMLRALLSALFLLYRERPGLCPEQKGDRRRRKSFVFQRQPSALDVPFEHGNAVAVLVSHKHPPSCGVQCKIPRRPAAATHGLHQLQCPVCLYRKDGNAVLSAIGHIQEAAVRRQMKVSSAVGHAAGLCHGRNGL